MFQHLRGLAKGSSHRGLSPKLQDQRSGSKTCSQAVGLCCVQTQISATKLHCFTFFFFLNKHRFPKQGRKFQLLKASFYAKNEMGLFCHLVPKKKKSLQAQTFISTLATPSNLTLLDFL